MKGAGDNFCLLCMLGGPFLVLLIVLAWLWADSCADSTQSKKNEACAESESTDRPKRWSK